MLKNKKMKMSLLALGTMVAITAPAISAISCGYTTLEKLVTEFELASDYKILLTLNPDPEFSEELAISDRIDHLPSDVKFIYSPKFAKTLNEIIEGDVDLSKEWEAMESAEKAGEPEPKMSEMFAQVKALYTSIYTSANIIANDAAGTLTLTIKDPSNGKEIFTHTWTGFAITTTPTT